MGLSDELKDPWGLLAAGVSGGMAWAVLGASVGAAALPVGVAVGAAVLGVKVVSGVLLNRNDEPAPEVRELPRPLRGSAADRWLTRAEAAVGGLDDLVRTAGAGPVAASLRGAASDSRATLTALARLGAQAFAVEGALARVDGQHLDEEAAHLRSRAQLSGPPGVHAEIARSRAALDDRIAVRDRLREARDTVLARMQAVALGLEGLVARMAEVLALAETTGTYEDTVGVVAELAGELEGLRAGLAETEAVSRSVLAAAPLPPAPLPPAPLPPAPLTPAPLPPAP